ncbi:MAG: EF-P lysine aminoacylase EpmA [Pseudomonadota bacterium]
MSWQPCCDVNVLKQRALLVSKIRAFFQKKQILEVETPLLSHSSNPDPHIESCQTQVGKKNFYLQTSPEFHMKRLLASGSGSIYQICKAFRNHEIGNQHNPEFTLLEWYHLDYDYFALMAEVDEFLQQVALAPKALKTSYQTLFEKYCKLNPHTASLASLKQSITQSAIKIDSPQLDRDDLLNLLMTHVIEPQLDDKIPIIIYDYPASQAALAKTKMTQGITVAKRFEVYYQGVELANGFEELTDATEQQQRFELQNQQRKAKNLATLPIDHYFLDALKAGLPDCSGVALGLDRLLMTVLDKPNLADILSFNYYNA